jgi:hypothetical protein
MSSLTTGRQHLDLARLLRHVLPGMLAVGVACDGDHRHARIEALDQPGDEVCGARPQRRVNATRPVGDLGVGICGEGTAALVIDEVMLQPECPTPLVERKQLKSAHAKDGADLRDLEHFGQGLSACHAARGVRRCHLSMFPLLIGR